MHTVGLTHYLALHRNGTDTDCRLILESTVTCLIVDRNWPFNQELGPFKNVCGNETSVYYTMYSHVH